MPVKSFECAIARSQIGRYLAGDTLGDEAMRQLESHITACADCQRLIEGKREELLGPLAHAPTASEAVAQETVAQETLATSTDVAAIERELRAAAARAGRVVVEMADVEAPVIAATEVRDLVGANRGPMASAASNPVSPSHVPVSHPVAEAFADAGRGGATSSTAKAGRSGIGSALGRVSLPRLVRDVPEPEETVPGRSMMPPAPATTTASAPKPANRALVKAGVYGGALVLVLGGMAFLGDPTKLLGGKATPVPANGVAMRGAKAETAAKPAIPVATGVRRNVLGVPITDAADPSPVKSPINKAAATRVAKADPADAGPGAFDPSLDAPTMPAAVVRPQAKAITKAGGAIPVAVTATTEPGGIPAKPAIKAKPTVKAKPVVAKALAKPLVRSGAKPLVKAESGAVATKPRAAAIAKSKSVIRRSAAKSGPTTSVDLVPVAPARSTVKPVARKSRPLVVRKRAPKRVAKRPAAPKRTNVIRVYDETGKPIN